MMLIVPHPLAVVREGWFIINSHSPEGTIFVNNILDIKDRALETLGRSLETYGVISYS